tara:strand:- start:3592 stop:3735 length:144 start_codon:yes stop_codon:yes gene_type:complete
MHKTQTPIILTVTDLAWMLFGLIGVSAIIYFCSYWAGVLSYVEAFIY